MTSEELTRAPGVVPYSLELELLFINVITAMRRGENLAEAPFPSWVAAAVNRANNIEPDHYRCDFDCDSCHMGGCGNPYCTDARCEDQEL